MVNTAEDSLALAAGSVALFFVVRMKRTYFLDSRFFMGVANMAFNIILVQSLFSDLARLPPSQGLFVGMISITAISIGVASYLLERNAGDSGLPELKAFLSKPPRPFLVYLSVVLGWAISGMLFRPWSLEPILAQQGVFHYSYQIWYLGLSSILLATFIFLPVTAAYRRSMGISEPKASRSLKMISLSWGGFGIILLLQVVMAAVQSVGVVVESLLFIVIAFALREPTVLSRMISTASSGLKRSYTAPGADTIVLYNMDSDRRNLVESFVREGIRAGRRSVCFVAKEETPFYTAILRGMQTLPSSSEGRWISVQPIENLLSSSASSALNAESELIDLGEVDISQSRRMVERAKAFDAANEPRKKNRTWAINVESADSSLLSLIRDLNPQGKTIDQANHQDSFSNLLGVRHRDILGARLLLEFDPSCQYESLVQKFVDEFQANVEPVAVFTSVGSPVHKGLGRRQSVRLFSFSAKTSTPSKGLGEEVLLPERDSSLLLDAVDKVLQTNHGQRIGLAFDVFTDLVLLQGFDKAYGVLSAVVEMVESESTTTLVLLNYGAHEERVLNGVRGLFSSQIIFDSNGVRPVRLKGPNPRKNYGQDASLVEGAVSRGVTGS